MQVFISYSSANKPFAEELLANLNRAGIGVWYAEWEILVGNSIIRKIQEGIKEADFLIVILSKASIESKWVREELEAGIVITIDRGAFVIPLLLEECELPPFLKGRKYADFTKNRDAAFRDLIKAILPDCNTTAVWQPHLQLVVQDTLSKILANMIKEDEDLGKTKEQILAHIADVFSGMKGKLCLPDEVFSHYITICTEKHCLLSINEFGDSIPDYIERYPNSASVLSSWLVNCLVESFQTDKTEE